MGIVIQVMHKTYCCNNDDKDKNAFNEDIESNDDDNDNDEKEKLILDTISSFHTNLEVST